MNRKAPELLSMPEGPQVYRIAQKLRKIIVGSNLEKLAIGKAEPIVINSTVTGVVTKGKRLMITLNDGQGILIAFALSGKLEYENSPPPASPTGSIVASLTFPSTAVTLNDPQHLAFAALDDISTITETLFPAGFDPLHTVMGMREWLSICRSHPAQLVATFLTNQNIVAGIGNRYRSEIMHAARISPGAKIRELTIQQSQLLLIMIYRILKPASRGEYVFQVYGRKESLPDGLPVMRKEVAKGIFVWTTKRAQSSESTDGTEDSGSEQTS